MVDLSKVKSGDTVKFRCGGEAKLSGAAKAKYGTYTLPFEQGYGDFTQEGFVANVPYTQTIFDIIEIIPAPSMEIGE